MLVCQVLLCCRRSLSKSCIEHYTGALQQQYYFMKLYRIWAELKICSNLCWISNFFNEFLFCYGKNCLFRWCWWFLDSFFQLFFNVSRLEWVFLMLCYTIRCIQDRSRVLYADILYSQTTLEWHNIPLQNSIHSVLCRICTIISYLHFNQFWTKKKGKTIAVYIALFKV